MARKVFLSVLGTGYYNRTKYFWKDEKNYVETRFIQEATLKLIAKDWGEDDIAYFFLTNQARELNWADPAQQSNYLVKSGERDTYPGLGKIMADGNFKFKYEDIDIENGNNENEIWQIFKVVFDVLEEGDEVYFDITHAFRSIPMLVMVLINYTKFLKNIKVKSITYGNWEGRNVENNMAPITDLTAFSELQDWTNAANNFLSSGSMTSISSLIPDEETKKNITSFTNMIYTCRAKDVFSGDIASILSNKIDKIDMNIAPFVPIKKKIVQKLSSYEKDDIIKNGMAAVRYCIDFNIIQQGITMLAEFVLTFILLKVDEDWEDLFNRDTVSGCLNINKIDSFSFVALENKLKGQVKNNNLSESDMNDIISKQKEIVKKVFELPYKKRLSNKVFKKLSQGIRNDINHAGIRQDPKTSEYLIDRLEKYYTEMTKIIDNVSNPQK